MKDFKEKVVVITGAGTGIGFALAKQFGNEGAKLVICGRRQNRIDEAVNQLKAAGYEAAGTTCDVAKLEDVEKLADFAWSTYGKADVLVNNAGVNGTMAPIFDVTANDFQDHFAINIYGTVNGVNVFGKRFIEQGTPCAIFNVGSENSHFDGLRGLPFASDYVTGKHAILGYTDSLRNEAPDFMDIGLICPGLVNSEFGDQGINFGMDTDKFAEITMQQIKDEKFFIVSHAYNMARIDERREEVKAAYDTYAPRYEGDVEFDVSTIVPPILAQRAAEAEAAETEPS